jgi:hypothetical protein
MNAVIRISSSITASFILAGLLTGCGDVKREVCVPLAPDFEGSGPGYELIDIVRREVWATRDWLPEEFTEFSPSLRWQKNDPRIPLHDGGRFLRSPGCVKDGQYSYMRAFDRHFLKVVELNSMPRPVDDRGLIRRTELEKYHVLYFAAGRTVSMLQSPTGQRFISVSKSLDRSLVAPSIPDSWTLTEELLTEELEVNLTGKVSVLRLQNEDSYQGPLPDAH